MQGTLRKPGPRSADSDEVMRWTALVATAMLMTVGPVQAVGDDSLQEVASARIVFGHQSVGWNVIEGMQAIYGARGVDLSVVDGPEGLPASGSGFAQVEIGSNGDPASKFAAFEQAVSAGSDVEVAAMKLCFVDITAGTDVRQVFGQYQAMVADLQAREPDVALLHITVPLTVGDPASNLKRQRYNTLVRRVYSASLLDLARVESTRPSGSRVVGRWHGHRYLSLFGGYAADEGHLNARGAKRVAAAFVAALAQRLG